MQELLVLLVLLLLSGAFSGSETALTTLSLARARALEKEGRPGAGALLALRRNTTRMLVVLLIGNNLVNIAASALATVLATRWFGHLGPGLAVGVLTLVVLVVGEITPKSFAALHAERVSLLAAPWVLAFGRLVLPLAWILEAFTHWLHRQAELEAEPTVTESELLSMAEHGAREGSIDPDEREMIERVFALDDLSVRDVMTPRHRVFSLPVDLTIEAALPLVLEAPYSRIPLYRGSPDEVQGVLHLRDLLGASAEGHLERSLGEIGSQPLYVPENQPIDRLFDLLRRQKRHLAVVVDEYGVLVGVASVEDVLEELVGEIYDESDRPAPTVHELAPGLVSAPGSAELRTLQPHFPAVELAGKPTDTVSLWLLRHHGGIPTEGETFELDGLRVTVERASSHRVQRVTVQLATDERPGEAPAD